MWRQPSVGWFDDQYLGIDQGPIQLLLESHRSGFFCNAMARTPTFQLGPAARRMQRHLAGWNAAYASDLPAHRADISFYAT
jgi:hypothetical protein